ncbi:hypothetical protein [Blastococcus sp. TBT05-19]|uniref:hypothetical protein n=1 Tax=Blastococcus sp. TBT05-19 TaxID=2250581 RepID=UPI0011BECC36|nr:hypothetical protein [Blastococcus sp. TBT05-19]
MNGDSLADPGRRLGYDVQRVSNSVTFMKNFLCIRCDGASLVVHLVPRRHPPTDLVERFDRESGPRRNRPEIVLGWVQEADHGGQQKVEASRGHHDSPYAFVEGAL